MEKVKVKETCKSLHNYTSVVVLFRDCFIVQYGRMNGTLFLFLLAKNSK